MVLNNFVVCGRCSFFLAGYRVLHGIDHLEAAAKESEGEWLQLKWDQEMRELVQKSYGGRLGTELYYYDSWCPECQRRFVFQAAAEGEPDSFRIELK